MYSTQNIQTNLYFPHSSVFLAFIGDISCNFETAHWDSGFCNWQYDFSSPNLLKLVEAPASDLTLKKRWKNGELKKIALISKKGF